MPRVFSMASHSTLQYLPEVIMHEHTGWTHSSAFVVDLVFLCTPDSLQSIQGNIVEIGGEAPFNKEHIRILAIAVRR